MKYPNSLSTQSRLILNLTGSAKNSIYLSDKRVWSPGSNFLNRNVMKKIIHYLEREEELCSHSFFETVLIKSSMHRPGAGLHFSKVWFRSKERLSHIPPSNCGLQTDLSINSDSTDVQSRIHGSAQPKQCTEQESIAIWIHSEKHCPQCTVLFISSVLFREDISVSKCLDSKMSDGEAAWKWTFWQNYTIKFLLYSLNMNI